MGLCHGRLGARVPMPRSNPRLEKLSQCPTHHLQSTLGPPPGAPRARQDLIGVQEVSPELRTEGLAEVGIPCRQHELEINEQAQVVEIRRSDDGPVPPQFAGDVRQLPC